MKNLLTVMAVMALGSSSSFGALVGVDLLARFMYQDLTTRCVVSSMGHGLHLNGTIRDGKVVQAMLANTASNEYQINFLPDELNGIEVTADAIGNYYVTTLPLSARLLSWMFFNFDVQWAIFGGCKPSQPLATLTPHGHIYKFRHQTSMDLFAPLQRFRGNRADGTPYAVTLGFTQRQTDF